MAVSIIMLERRARYLMGAAAVVAVATLAAFEMGWIATAPHYKENAWYLVGGNASFIVTSEYADEAACRREESASSVCRPGKALLEEAQAVRPGQG
ncbi:hypothetical protein [Janthinobacterium sp. 17J80-10]|uniref:hypothetical protein n=1 Tax=Janthinobacterium sp. 17J80-10 TaxID=2497863 RepID=UPI0010059278|nr:hypothetical protein [Janthinobacterium sp. 17J80-10]QAU32922.1 hypothetical protein EKL02_01330 [Janthinobacterium sp. 17J80-10]